MDWRTTLIALASALSLFAVSPCAEAQSSVSSPDCARPDVDCITVSGTVAFGPGPAPPAAVDIGVSYTTRDSMQVRASAPDFRFEARIPRFAAASFVLRNLPLPWLNDRPMVFNGGVQGPQSITLPADAGVPVIATFRYPVGSVAPASFQAVVKRSPRDSWFQAVDISNGQFTFAARRDEPYVIAAAPEGFGNVAIEFPPQASPHSVVVDVDRRGRTVAQQVTLLEGRWRRVQIPLVLAERAPSAGGLLPYRADTETLSTRWGLRAGRRQRLALIEAVIGYDGMAGPARTAFIRFAPNAADVPPVPDIPVSVLNDNGPGLPPVLSLVGASLQPSRVENETLPEMEYIRPEGRPGEAWILTLELDRPAPAGGAEVTVDTVSQEFLDFPDPFRSSKFEATERAAVEGADYQPIVQQRVVFAPGERTATVRVEGIGNDRIEVERSFHLAFTDSRGLVPRDPSILLRIRNDDVDGSPAARPDVLPVTPLVRANRLEVLANDNLPAERYPTGRLEITQAPLFGAAAVDTRATATPIDDRITYTPPAGRAGQVDRFAYRLCNAVGEDCVAARVDVPVRPVPSIPITWVGSREAGFRDVVMSGLPALLDARIELLAKPLERTEEYWGFAKRNPQSRFAPVWGRTLELPPIADGGPAEVTRTVFVQVHGEPGSDIDLYVGYDTDGKNGITEDEVLCASASAGTNETCVVSFPQKRMGSRSLQIGIANPGPLDVSFRMARGGIDGIGPLPGVTATGPTRLAEGEEFPIRISWRNDATPLRAGVLGLLRLRNADGRSLGDVPLAIDLTEYTHPVAPASAPQPRALRPGETQEFAFAAVKPLDRMFIDVPPGTAQLGMSVSGGTIFVPLTLSLRRAELRSTGSEAGIDVAPAEDAASIVRTSSASTPIEVVVANPAAGRWFAVLSAPGSVTRVRVTPTLTTATPAPVVRPGGYFNPSRSGHGLFLYPAGNDWAGLWYTYTQDGAPVWYYLQGAKPGANGIWTAPIFRSGWNGSRSHLTEVGRATITPTAADAFQFTYVLDGELGSEPFSSFGRGCPSIDGRVVDASGHWFDPARAGAGYSVQLLPNYEFYVVFGYSARGVPRFLLAERNGMGGVNETLPLEQLRGFCPLCVRTGNPERSTVGVLRREFVNGQLSRIATDAAFTNGTPGTWVVNDAVVPLGGLQGCVAN